MTMCGCESCAQPSITTFFIVTARAYSAKARTIWKTYIQHSIDDACCIRCVVIICYCCEKINATYCAFLPAALTAAMRFSQATLIFHFIFIDHPCEYDVHTVSKTEWERCTPSKKVRKKEGKKNNNNSDIMRFDRTGICDANIRDRGPWQTNGRKKIKITRKLSCFGWIIWWNEIVKKKRITWNLGTRRPMRRASNQNQKKWNDR